MSSWRESRAARVLGLAIVVCIAACVSAAVEPGANDPASSAVISPLPQVGEALEHSFEPGAAQAAESISPAVPSQAGGEASPAEATWTCPMHPQIIRKEPGTCPICGMKLKPVPPKAPSTGAP